MTGCDGVRIPSLDDGDDVVAWLMTAQAGDSQKVRNRGPSAWLMTPGPGGVAKQVGKKKRGKAPLPHGPLPWRLPMVPPLLLLLLLRLFA